MYREPPCGPAARRKADANVKAALDGQPLGKKVKRQSPGGWRGAWPTEKACFKGCFLPRPALPPVV